MEKLNSDGTAHRPERISLDFEAAMIKVLQTKFPGVNITGFFFHFRKNLWQKLQDLGLTRLYHRNPEFQTWVNMIAALSYVPTERVVKYYETVILGILEEKETEEVKEAEEDEVEEEEGKEGEPDDNTWASWLKEIYSYIDYIETTYIGKRSVNSTRNQTTVPRRKPLFKHNLWNQFKLVTTEEEIVSPEGTNNMLDSFNRLLNKLLGNNPNIWQAIDSFVSQEAETR